MTEDDIETNGGEEDVVVAETEAQHDSPRGPDEREELQLPKRTPLTELFGESARVKLLDVFVATNQSALSASEIAEFGSIDISTVRTSLDVFLENDVIEETGTVGYSPMYALNEDNPVADAIQELDEALEEISDGGPDVDLPAEDDPWADSPSSGSDGENEGESEGGAWSSR